MPVYFVDNGWYQREVMPQRSWGHDHDHDHDGGPGRGRGRGHGRGHDD